jgi:glycosyltransferase involved in cell wall biosynthesis
MTRKRIVMLGTRFDTMGGISAVVDVYRKYGLFDRFPVSYLATHRDGSAWDKLTTLLKALLVYCRWIFRGEVALVHAHTSSRASFWRKSLFLWPAILLGRPVILHLHGSEFAIFHDNECGPIRRAMIRKLFDKCARVIVLSAAWKEWVQGMCSNNQVIAIYNPVLLNDHVRWQDRVPGTILSLGRLGRRKGSYDLVAAMVQLKEAGRRIQLQLGGDGELENVLSHAKQLGVNDCVALLGWVKGADKQHVLNSAMVYTLPSYNEGLPMSVLEAMANGLPVVSTPIGGIPEAISDGVEGFLVQPGDVAGLARALLTLTADTALAERMGNAAREKVERTFSAQAVIPLVEAIYESLGCPPADRVFTGQA